MPHLLSDFGFSSRNIYWWQGHWPATYFIYALYQGILGEGNNIWCTRKPQNIYSNETRSSSNNLRRGCMEVHTIPFSLRSLRRHEIISTLSQLIDIQHRTCICWRVSFVSFLKMTTEENHLPTCRIPKDNFCLRDPKSEVSIIMYIS